MGRIGIYTLVTPTLSGVVTSPSPTVGTANTL
jgi:hypothetical protein